MLTSALCRRVFVGLGSNLGATVETLRRAAAQIAKLPQCKNFACSSIYRSAPLATDTEQPDYLNAVVRFDTTLATDALWTKLVAIETGLGRVRSTVRNAARVIDIDLLMVGSERHATDTLTLPHPRMAERAFVLLPLAEIAPDVVIDGKGALAALLAALENQRIERLKETYLCN
jgi:2-amino-4-hydroxy-6-hydroxymethyldihydropteridine diphosphokinase